VKTVFIATLLAITTIALTETAAAGWCIEACGLQRVPKQQTRETVCTTVRRGNHTETVCTSN
jgi:hypothetical protein